MNNSILWLVFGLWNWSITLQAQYRLDSIGKGTFLVEYTNSKKEDIVVDTFFYLEGVYGNASYYIEPPYLYFSYMGYQRPRYTLHIQKYLIDTNKLSSVEKYIVATYKFNELRNFSYELNSKGFAMKNKATNTESILTYIEFSEKKTSKDY